MASTTEIGTGRGDLGLSSGKLERSSAAPNNGGVCMGILESCDGS
jgi:hypothetical protein